MNKYIETSHKALAILQNFDKIHVVLGNESCDLDSVVSSLVYAYFIHEHYKENHRANNTAVIPVLNINNDEFPLRTESKYFLSKYEINEKDLTFRNQIDLSRLSAQKKLNLTLVDHHVLSKKDENLTDDIIEVIDHRPLDKSSQVDRTKVLIDPVGSCCTLVANKILETAPNLLTKDVAELLYGTIVLDTVNFNEDANRFKELDSKIAAQLENKFKITEKRSDFYAKLVKARSDVSALTPLQILHRDLKFVDNVGIPGVPMLVEEFLKICGAAEALKEFYGRNNNVVLPMGLVTRDGVVFRDLGVYGEDSSLKRRLVEVLRKSGELEVREVTTGVELLVLFRQGNVKMSRKHIIPIVRTVLEECNDKKLF